MFEGIKQLFDFSRMSDRRRMIILTAALIIYFNYDKQQSRDDAKNAQKSIQQMSDKRHQEDLATIRYERDQKELVRNDYKEHLQKDIESFKNQADADRKALTN